MADSPTLAGVVLKCVGALFKRLPAAVIIGASVAVGV